MIIYTLAFTLAGKNPKDNKYLQMFWIWLRFLCKYAGLRTNDKIYVLMDRASIDYLEQYNTYISLDISYELIEIPQPATVQDGILERFQAWKYFSWSEEEVVCYIDIDMFVLADVHWVEQVCKPSTIFVFPEELMLGENYLGEILTERDKAFFAAHPVVAERHPGFTGTFFFFQGDFVRKPFETIIQLTRENTLILYANEQPFYNRVLFDALYYTKEFQVCILNKGLIEYNCTVGECEGGAKLINFCGEPGDGELHWAKMFMAFLADT